MKKLFAFFAVMIFAAQVFGVEAKRSPKEVITEERVLTAFSKISVSVPAKVEIVTGQPHKAVVSCDARYISDLKTEVSGGELFVRLRNDDKKRITYKFEGEIYIKIFTEDLTELSVSGAANVSFPEKTVLKDFTLENSGATKTVFSELHVLGKFDAEIHGASKLELSGVLSRVDMEISGASKTVFSDIRVEGSFDVELSGASKFELSGEFSKVRFNASGASKIDFAGNTGLLDIDISGASKVMLSGRADTSYFSASGASKIESESFKTDIKRINFSGASKINIMQ